jgi:hypothetical protein
MNEGLINDDPFSLHLNMNLLILNLFPHM